MLIAFLHLLVFWHTPLGDFKVLLPAPFDEAACYRQAASMTEYAKASGQTLTVQCVNTTELV